MPTATLAQSANNSGATDGLKQVGPLPSLKRVEPGIDDVGPLGLSERDLGVDLRVSNDFSQLYHLRPDGTEAIGGMPGWSVAMRGFSAAAPSPPPSWGFDPMPFHSGVSPADAGYARIGGGVVAVFPRSIYTPTGRGARRRVIAEVPPGTIFHIGDPAEILRALTRERDRAEAEANAALQRGVDHRHRLGVNGLDDTRTDGRVDRRAAAPERRFDQGATESATAAAPAGLPTMGRTLPGFVGEAADRLARADGAEDGEDVAARDTGAEVSGVGPRGEPSGCVLTDGSYRRARIGEMLRRASVSWGPPIELPRDEGE